MTSGAKPAWRILRIDLKAAAAKKKKKHERFGCSVLTPSLQVFIFTVTAIPPNVLVVNPMPEVKLKRFFPRFLVSQAHWSAILLFEEVH